MNAKNKTAVPLRWVATADPGFRRMPRRAVAAAAATNGDVKMEGKRAGNVSGNDHWRRNFGIKRFSRAAHKTGMMNKSQIVSLG